MLERKSSWQLRAACRTAIPADSFFTQGYKEAVAFCKNCPVVNECASYAIAHNERGVWGGTTYYERWDLS